MKLFKVVDAGFGSSPAIQMNPWELALCRENCPRAGEGPMQEAAFLKERKRMLVKWNQGWSVKT